jgi:hypothetical protein
MNANGLSIDLTKTHCLAYQCKKMYCKKKHKSELLQSAYVLVILNN